jgi:hypothetical protein
VHFWETPEFVAGAVPASLASHVTGVTTVAAFAVEKTVDAMANPLGSFVTARSGAPFFSTRSELRPVRAIP